LGFVCLSIVVMFFMVSKLLPWFCVVCVCRWGSGGIILVGLFVGCQCLCNGPHYFISNWLYQSTSGDPPTKKYINPSSFQSMVKSYGKELLALTSIHHIRGSYEEDPRKKEGWKSGSWERITHKSAKEVIEKNVAYAVRLDITGTIAQISLWMSRLQHLLRLHQIPKLLRMHQLLRMPNWWNCWECTNCWNSNNSTTKEWSEESSNTTTNTRRTISAV